MMTAADIARQRGVHLSTVGRAIQKAGLKAARGATFNDDEVARILGHMRPAQPQQPAPETQPERKEPSDAVQVAQDRTQPESKEVPGKHPIAQVASQPAQSDEVANLKAELAELKAEFAAQQEQFALFCRWGTKAALAIRELWRRMPDYAPGATPGEFPAITQDVLDEYGKETDALLKSVDKQTDEFFAALDQRAKTDKQESNSPA